MSDEPIEECNTTMHQLYISGNLSTAHAYISDTSFKLVLHEFADLAPSVIDIKELKYVTLSSKALTTKVHVSTAYQISCVRPPNDETDAPEWKSIVAKMIGTGD